VSPRVVQAKPAEPRFTVNADRGVLAREGDEIFLYDNVLLVREPDAQHPGTRITTSFLHIVRDRSIVRTDREVTVVEGRRSLSGRGMEFNNESRELVLHGDVRARFEPEKK
jgi:LPS export ABC transporter protein LptC